MNELTFNGISMIVKPNFDNVGLYDVFLKYPNTKSKTFSLRRENMGYGFYWYVNNNSLRIFDSEHSWLTIDMMFDLFKNLVSELECYQI